MTALTAALALAGALVLIETTCMGVSFLLRLWRGVTS